MNLYSLFWQLAKHIDPESVHHTTLHLLHLLPDLAKVFAPMPNDTIQGHHISWRNSIGIAAGLDKNALALNFWDKLGIGCIEVGTVTPQAQYGNDRPRIFRIDNKNLLNAMGFPSEGSDIVYKRVIKFKAHYQSTMPIWINLGKQRDTSLDKAASDYNYLIKKFASIADALVINISSPNTTDLRLLQSDKYLENLLSELHLNRNAINKNCALLLKVSPDESLEFYHGLPSLLKNHHWQGVIATNTTAKHLYERGGLSGEDLFQKSFEIAKILSPECERLKLDFIFVGGLNSFGTITEITNSTNSFFFSSTAPLSIKDQFAFKTCSAS